MEKRSLVLTAFLAVITFCYWGCTRNVTFTPPAPLSAQPTDTPTDTPVPTDTPTHTWTIVSSHGTMTPTATWSDTPTVTETPTVTMTFTVTNTRTWSPTVTATVDNWDFSSGVTTLLPGVYHFGCVHIGAGAVVTISGQVHPNGVTIFTKCFTLDAGATITGVGVSSRTTGTNEGAGFPCDSRGVVGGAGHGGAGGGMTVVVCSPAVTVSCNGGVTYDDPVYPSGAGSFGGYGGCLYYGYGGSLLRIVVYDPDTDTLTGPATINGTIDMSGAPGPEIFFDGGCYLDGPGGSGGTIFIEADSIVGTGSLLANGGKGTDMGGGGGGGIISLIENLASFDGIISAAGGAGGSNAAGTSGPGEPGIVTFTAAPASGY